MNLEINLIGSRKSPYSEKLSLGCVIGNHRRQSLGGWGSEPIDFGIRGVGVSCGLHEIFLSYNVQEYEMRTLFKVVTFNKWNKNSVDDISSILCYVPPYVEPGPTTPSFQTKLLLLLETKSLRIQV